MAPFDFEVLIARMRALLRRSKKLRQNVLQVADLSLNTLDQTATRGGRAIRLTAKEYALLELLMLHPGQILGRAQIAEHVWDENFDPLSNSIDAYVKRLRKGEELTFWSADSELRSKVMDTFASTGARAIVAEAPPLCANKARWKQLPHTNYYVYMLHRDGMKERYP